MHSALRSLELTLAKRSLYQLPSRAHWVTCRTGSLWITQDNDPRDIVLAAGESFLTDAHRNTIAYALDAATLSVRPATAAPARRLRRSATRDMVLE